MQKIIAAALVLAIAPLLAGCLLTLPNPFGGTPLTLTGSLKNDLPGIEAYASAVKAGIKTDVAQIRTVFVDYLCPLVSSTQVSLADPGTAQTVQNTATAVLGSATAAQKQVNNVGTGLRVASKFCAAGTAADVKSAFLAGVDAVKTVENLIKQGSAGVP